MSRLWAGSSHARGHARRLRTGGGAMCQIRPHTGTRWAPQHCRRRSVLSVHGRRRCQRARVPGPTCTRRAHSSGARSTSQGMAQTGSSSCLARSSSCLALASIRLRGQAGGGKPRGRACMEPRQAWARRPSRLPCPLTCRTAVPCSSPMPARSKAGRELRPAPAPGLLQLAGRSGAIVGLKRPAWRRPLCTGRQPAKRRQSRPGKCFGAS